MAIDLSRYTGGVLTTKDYVDILKERVARGLHPECPVIKRVWRHLDEKERELEKRYGASFQSQYSNDFMRYIDDYGIRSGIY